MKELCSFLGLANYYRRFVEGYSRNATPLTKLLKNGVTWEWTDECQKVFNELKTAMMKGSVLALPDISKPFKVQMDASDFALEGGPFARGSPRSIMSHKLFEAKRWYTAQEMSVSQ